MQLVQQRRVVVLLQSFLIEETSVESSPQPPKDLYGRRQRQSWTQKWLMSIENGVSGTPLESR